MSLTYLKGSLSGGTKVLQNRTGQPKTEPNRHRRWKKKVKPKASVRFRFSLPVSPEAFGFTREIEFLPRARYNFFPARGRERGEGGVTEFNAGK